MSRLRLQAGHSREPSLFQFKGDAYVYESDDSSFDDEERREREEGAIRKREQLMLWSDQIKMHSRILSGDSEASLTTWW